MKKLFALFLVSLMLPIGCGSDGDGTYEVEGTVVRNGAPVTGVEATVGDFENLRDQTDEEGRFRISGVPAGEYELVLRDSGEGESFSTRTLSLMVNDNVTLEALKLPEPVELQSLANITTDTIDLAWTESTADDFREYKVYRNDTSGLDETTGELVHVATEATETSFTDTELLPNETYFYRVFVLNEFGQIGGSNIESATTTDREYLGNPGFESLEGGFAADWTRAGNPESVVTVDDTVSASGTRSAKFAMPESYEYWVEQPISTAGLEAGDRLVVRGSMRADRADADIDPSVIVNSEFYSVPVPDAADTWTDFEVEILVPDAATMEVGVHFVGPFDAVLTNVWIDDLSMRRAP